MAETNYLDGKLYVVCFFRFHEIVPFVKKLLIINVISIKMSNFATLLCAYIGNFLK